MRHVDTASIVTIHEGRTDLNSFISGVKSSMKWPTTTASIGLSDSASIQKWKLDSVVPLQN